MRKLISISLLAIVAFAIYAGNDPYSASKLWDKAVQAIRVG